MATLRDRLLEGVTIASEEESANYFRPNDFRWGETLQGEDSPTGQPIIFINDRKYRQAGSRNYRDKAIFGESLHLLKNVAPEWYDYLYKAATSDPEFMDWNDRSYYLETRGQERRPYRQWFNVSRFDQVLGGFLQAGDPDIPTMRDNWPDRNFPYGTKFRRALEEFEQVLDEEL